MRTESTAKLKKKDLVFEIIPSKIEEVKAQCIKKNLPLIEEYDFRRDIDNERSPNLKIELNSQTYIRSY